MNLSEMKDGLTRASEKINEGRLFVDPQNTDATRPLVEGLEEIKAILSAVTSHLIIDNDIAPSGTILKSIDKAFGNDTIEERAQHVLDRPPEKEGPEEDDFETRAPDPTALDDLRY